MPETNSIAQRCLALTGCFETSTSAPGCFAGLTGDFDGMGLSFGALQWNLRQQTLQPLFTDMLTQHPAAMQASFGSRLGTLERILQLPVGDQVAWAQSIQDLKRLHVLPPWKESFEALGRTSEFQSVQVAHSAHYFHGALALCARFGLHTERALALMFDIGVQNGSIDGAVEAHIRRDFEALRAEDEEGRLRSVANRRAEAAGERYREDVRIRKLTIANGVGQVHGIRYDLETQFGIRLQPTAVLNPSGSSTLRPTT